MTKNSLRQLAACLIIISGLLVSCASVPLQIPREIESFSLTGVFPLGLDADKVLQSSKNELLYAMSNRNQEITVFRSGKRQNVLSGLGSGSANFQYLSDMAIALDGSLLVLDSSAKAVRKFAPDGTPGGSLELKSSLQPTLLALQSEQTLFVYDAAPAEIIAYSTLDGTEQFRFGRFQLRQVSSLFCNRDYLVAYSDTDDQSTVFSSLGQFIKSSPGNCIFDGYNNELNYAGGTLKSNSGTALYPLGGKLNSIGIDNDLLFLNQGSEVQILKVNYLQER